MATFTPYGFEPVLYPDVDFRLTYVVEGNLTGATLYLAGVGYPFTVAGDGKAIEVVVPWDTVKDVPDRARASVTVTTGGYTELLLNGHVVKG